MKEAGYKAWAQVASPTYQIMIDADALFGAVVEQGTDIELVGLSAEAREAIGRTMEHGPGISRGLIRAHRNERVEAITAGFRRQICEAEGCELLQRGACSGVNVRVDEKSGFKIPVARIRKQLAGEDWEEAAVCR